MTRRLLEQPADSTTRARGSVEASSAFPTGTVFPTGITLPKRARCTLVVSCFVPPCRSGSAAMLGPRLSPLAFTLVLFLSGLWLGGLIAPLHDAKAQQTQRTQQDRKVKASMRIMLVPNGTRLAQATADGGPSGTVEDMPSDWQTWEMPSDSVGPSPYGCRYTWPSRENDGTYRHRELHFFYSAGVVEQSSGGRRRFQLTVHSPAAPKDSILSVAWCAVPASEIGLKMTERYMKYEAKARNETGTVLTFTTEYESPARR